MRRVIAEITCDRCGKLARELCHNSYAGSGWVSSNPSGWGRLLDKDLCPVCMDEHRSFMAGRKPAP